MFELKIRYTPIAIARISRKMYSTLPVLLLVLYRCVKIQENLYIFVFWKFETLLLLVNRRIEYIFSDSFFLPSYSFNESQFLLTFFFPVVVGENILLYVSNFLLNKLNFAEPAQDSCNLYTFVYFCTGVYDLYYLKENKHLKCIHSEW